MKTQNALSPEPRESYSYSLVTDDFKYIRRHFRRPLTYLQILSPVLLLFVFTFNPNLALRSGWIITIAVNIAAYIVYRIRWNKLFMHLSGSVYHLEVYNSYFTITSDNLLTEKHTTKVNFVSITQTDNIGSCLRIITNGGNYYVRKDILAENSAIYATAATLGRKNTSKPMSRRIKTVALVLTILAVAAFVGAVCIYGYILAAENKIYFVFIFTMFAFPIVSAIYLLILNFKGYYVTTHLIISFVSVALIFVVVIFTGLTLLPSYITTTEPIASAEEYFNIDVPKYESMGTYTQTLCWPFDHHHYLSVVRFYSTEFRESVYANSNWLSNPPEALEDIAVYVNYNHYYYRDADYVMLYNMDTGELNTLPSENGTYHFIAVYYETHSHNDTLYIVEYDVEYTK